MAITYEKGLFTYENYYRNQRNKKDAGEVLDKLVYLIETYDCVSVADLMEMLLFGERRGRNTRRDGGKSYVSYSSYYGDGHRNNDQDRGSNYSRTSRARHDFDDIEITNVIYNDPATIVFWSDNTKTIVKVTNEKFDPEKGLAMAIAKKYYGNQGSYFNHLKKWIPSYKSVASKAKHKVGDQISFDLKGFGHYTATAQKVNDDGSIIFLFDTILPEEHHMNNESTNAGGFGKSDLKKWIDRELLPAFPDDIRSQIRELTIPTVSQIFGKDEWCEGIFVSDQDEQWSLMKTADSRRAKRNGDYDWYWLQNATKKGVSAAFFAFVSINGIAHYSAASYSFGVRPCLVIEPLRGDKEETCNA